MSTNRTRTDIAAWTAIAIGLVLGMLLKRVRWGFIIGLAIGFIAVFLLWRKKK
ncbi:MAG: hypothetical protein JNM68_16030 [Dinghuibacter sp.]|nr:hypothetical protein [Dinghuibacter sp.]